MAKNKYDHLFTSGASPEVQASRPLPVIGFLDGRTYEGCNGYMVFWVGPKSYGPYGTQGWGKISHGPHMHKYPELMMHLGTDPDNPMELGAEVEMCVGPEMEKHVITRSTIIYLPPNFVHGPWTIKKVNRPFLIVTVNQSTKHTEKALRDMIPAEDHKRTIFMDAGYEDEGIKPSFTWPEEAGPVTRYM
jgi:hypothetical protein